MHGAKNPDHGNCCQECGLATLRSETGDAFNHGAHVLGSLDVMGIDMTNRRETAYSPPPDVGGFFLGEQVRISGTVREALSYPCICIFSLRFC